MNIVITEKNNTVIRADLVSGNFVSADKYQDEDGNECIVGTVLYDDNEDAECAKDLLKYQDDGAYVPQRAIDQAKDMLS